MSLSDKKRASRKDFVLAVIMIAGGLSVSGIAMMPLASRDHVQMAQTTQQPPDASPSVPAGKDGPPAESTPGGTRPTSPSPEPARPDADAQKAGSKPALPPAPAEKMGDPVRK